jgi:lipopolysaccharide transport system permease protein
MEKMATVAEEPGWDVVIAPDKGWLRIGFKEIWDHRDLVVLMVRRDIISVHKQTVLGPLWHVVTPLLTTLIFGLMFGRIAKLPTDGLPPTLFYLSGLIPWGFFGTTLTKTSGSFISQAHLLTKVYFPRLIVPLSISIANFISFAIQLLLLAGFIAYFTIVQGTEWQVSASLLFLPVVVLMIGMLGLAVGILIAAATIRFRDLNFLIGFGVQLLMYMSPVIFPPSLLEGSTLGTIVSLNPMTPLINAFRASVFGGDIIFGPLMYSLAFILIALLFGVAAFKRAERTFADVV